MEKFSNIINEASDQTVFLSSGRGGFVTKKYGPGSISELNNKIYQYINNVYGPFGFVYPRGGAVANYDIDVDGKIINTEYISKMVNNYTVFKAFIRENRIRDAKQFYAQIEASFDDVYHYNGKFFRDQTLPILINTSRKGNKSEIKCNDVFEKFARRKGLDITVIAPTISEDIDGIDGKFLYNGKYLTIQVKPYTSYESQADVVAIESPGSLSIGTDYLVLYKYNSYIIIRNPKNNKIEISGSKFVAPLSNCSFI